uniref:Putative secreted protein n=1 Tax=Ixodes ricinus TaxID=34613 RepID=A0A6B0U5Y1_IXORI
MSKTRIALFLLLLSQTEQNVRNSTRNSVCQNICSLNVVQTNQPTEYPGIINTTLILIKSNPRFFLRLRIDMFLFPPLVI